MATPSSLLTGLCTFPISPTLLPLHRLLYYLSLLSALLYPTPPPLIKGAFAYSLTYAAIASLYSILILALSSAHPLQPPLNLDILPLWPILATAAISLPAFLHYNPNLAARTAARPIVRAWGLLITAGAACAFINLAAVASAAHGPVLPDTMLQQCRAVTPPPRLLRNPAHVGLLDPAVLATPLFRRVADVTGPLTFVPLAFGAVACLVTIAPARAPAAHDEVFVSAEVLDDGAATAFGFLHAAYLRLRWLVVGLTPGVWVVVVVLGEMFLLGTGLPVAEEAYEVGQWGVWAGLGLVAAAAVVNWVVGSRDGGVNGGLEVIRHEWRLMQQ
jgi:hypothetical protein